METRLRFARPLMAAILTAGLVLTGCGSDDGEDTASSPPPSSAPDSSPEETTEEATDDASPSAAPADADVDEFCETLVDAEAAASQGPDVDFENASPEEIQAALMAFGEMLNPILDDLIASAPEDIAADVEALVATLRSGLESGEDPSGNPEFVEANAAVNDYAFEECGFETVDVTAVDYDFEGVPDTLAAGEVTGFRFSNEGEEVHEMVIFNLGDDERPLDELLELPDEELEGILTFVGASFAGPGDENGTFQRLESGRHAMVCFIPLGTTSLEQLEEGPPPEEEGSGPPSEAASGEPPASEEASSSESGAPPEGDGGEGGPPHFTQGMVVEFVVE